MSEKNFNLKSLLFTIFNPGFIIIALIPWLLTQIWNYTIDIGISRYIIGLIIMTIGAYFYIAWVISFFKQGKGTPTIPFTGKTKDVSGEEQTELIISRVYKFSRNPMYFGIFLIVLGVGFISEFVIILIWAFVALIVFHLIIMKIKEPHLIEKYGDEYKNYLSNTSRWIGFKSLNKK